MREIEFRGVNEAVGMVYGFYAFIPKFVRDIGMVEHWIVRNDGFKHPIIPETLGQYSGLDDAKDRKIFEGDYLKDEENFIWEVVFADGAFCIESPDLMGRDFLFLGCQSFEVVGNIHENEYKGGGIVERRK